MKIRKLFKKAAALALAAVTALSVILRQQRLQQEILVRFPLPTPMTATGTP